MRKRFIFYKLNAFMGPSAWRIRFARFIGYYAQSENKSDEKITCLLYKTLAGGLPCPYFILLQSGAKRFLTSRHGLKAERRIYQEEWRKSLF